MRRTLSGAQQKGLQLQPFFMCATSAAGRAEAAAQFLVVVVEDAAQFAGVVTVEVAVSADA